MKVGFIGLGTMGSSMAYNCLQGGNDMIVHDIRREAATPHLEAGRGMGRFPQGGSRGLRRGIHLPAGAGGSGGRGPG